MSGSEGNLSPAATKFLAIVSGTGVAVAAVAAMTPPVVGMAAAVAGLAYVGKKIYDALPGGEPTGAAVEPDEDEEQVEEEQPQQGAQPEQHAEPEQDAEPEANVGADGQKGKRRRRRKKRGAADGEAESEPLEGVQPSEEGGEADEQEEKGTAASEPASDDDDGWAVQRGKPKRAPRSAAEREAARQAEIQRHATEIMVLARSVVGSPNFPVRTDGERRGCVTHGPDYPVPNELALEVRALVEAREGEVVRTGGMELTIHIVNKGPKVYNVTLHRRYRADNPETKANVHVTA